MFGFPAEESYVSELSKNHKWALKWAAKGVPVFPCVEGDKIPATENGFHDATTDVDQINAWWTTNPNYNVAASPHSAGCVVLDTDAPEAIDTLEMIHGALPATVIVRTPRGGFHYWFKGYGKNSSGRLAQKVDTRGEGGYVLLPPSTITSYEGEEAKYNGNSYEVISKAEIAPMPPTMLALIQPKAGAKGIEASAHALDLPAAISRGKQMARSWERAEWGTIDDTTYLHCAQLADIGLSKETIYEIIQHDWYERTNTEGDLERLYTVAESATVNRENVEGVWAVPDAKITYAHLEGRVEASKPSKFKLLDEAAQDNLPPPSWLIKGVLPANTTNVLYAGSKSWKTFLAVDWGMTIASGLQKWGEVEAGAVVYLAAEGATGLGKSRRPAWRLLNGVTDPVPFYVIPDICRVNDPSEVIEMCEEVKRTVGKVKLIVIDTMARAMVGLDENAAKDSAIAIEAFEMIKRTLDTTVLVLAHTGRDETKGLRGSSNHKAGFDNGFQIKTDKASSTSELWADWYRDAETPEFPWKLKAEKVLNSLAFRFADPDEMPAKDRITAADVGTALRSMNVFTEDEAVEQKVVEYQIAILKSWPEKKVRMAFKFLLASGKLDAFKTAKGKFFFQREPEEEQF